MRYMNSIERKMYSLICRNDGIKARDIAKQLGMDKTEINRLLYASPFIHELCYCDTDFNWRGLIGQSHPHTGLSDFCGYYADAARFLAQSEEEWLEELKRGCRGIGRNLNDSRGLFHSFRDCRETVVRLFDDLLTLLGKSCLDWEIAFELRLKRSRYVRIYADVLIITENRVFSLEFKMKDTIDPDEVQQAAKYAPFLEIVFGPKYEIIPVLVLTKAAEIFDFVPIGRRDMVLPVCSGDMLFNVFDEYIGFLN